LFQGASALNLDAKGRMSVPARHRDALLLQGEGRVTLTKHPDGCLLLFPRPEWEAFRARVAQLPMDAHWWRRIFLELRTAANIEREIMLLGMGSHLEIWDANTYASKEQAAIAQGMPDALKQFTF
jgi:MraZ protein